MSANREGNDGNGDQDSRQGGSYSGGGKILPRRSHQGPSKPYDRPSFFRLVGSKVKDMLTPTWLRGSTSTAQNGRDDMQTTSMANRRGSNVRPILNEPMVAGGDEISIEMEGCHATFSSQLLREHQAINSGAMTTDRNSFVARNSGIVTHSYDAPRMSCASMPIDQYGVAPSMTGFNFSDRFRFGQQQAATASAENSLAASRLYEQSGGSAQRQNDRMDRVSLVDARSDLNAGNRLSSNTEGCSGETANLTKTFNDTSVLKNHTWSTSQLRRPPLDVTKPSFNISAFHEEISATRNTFLTSSSPNHEPSVPDQHRFKSSFYGGKTVYGGVASTLKTVYEAVDPSPYQRRREERVRGVVKPTTNSNGTASVGLSATARRMLETLEKRDGERSSLLSSSRTPRRANLSVRESPLTFTPSIYHRNSAKYTRGPPVHQLITPTVAVVRQNRAPLYSPPKVQETEGFIPGVPETRPELRRVGESNDGMTGSSTFGPGKMKSIKRNATHYSHKDAIDNDAEMDFEQTAALTGIQLAPGCFNLQSSAFTSTVRNPYIFSTPLSSVDTQSDRKNKSECTSTVTFAEMEKPKTLFKFRDPEPIGDVDGVRNGGNIDSKVDTPPKLVTPAPAKASNNGVKPSLSELFKSQQAACWTCTECYASNPNINDKCLSCLTPKPVRSAVVTSAVVTLQAPTSVSIIATTKQPSLSDAFKKKEGEWACPTCMLTNKSESLKCVACEEPKPGAATVKLPSLMDAFKKKEGEWVCPTCMVTNKSEILKCAACESAKPGVTNTSQTKENANGVQVNPGGGFSFSSICPAATSPGGFKFNSAATSSVSISSNTLSGSFTATGGFQFGSTVVSSVGSTGTASTAAPAGGFKFTMPSSSSTQSIFGSNNSNNSSNVSGESGGFKFSGNQTGVRTSGVDNVVADVTELSRPPLRSPSAAGEPSAETSNSEAITVTNVSSPSDMFGKGFFRPPGSAALASTTEGLGSVNSTSSGAIIGSSMAKSTFGLNADAKLSSDNKPITGFNFIGQMDPKKSAPNQTLAASGLGLFSTPSAAVGSAEVSLSTAPFGSASKSTLGTPAFSLPVASSTNVEVPLQVRSVDSSRVQPNSASAASTIKPSGTSTGFQFGITSVSAEKIPSAVNFDTSFGSKTTGVAPSPSSIGSVFDAVKPVAVAGLMPSGIAAFGGVAALNSSVTTQETMSSKNMFSAPPAYAPATSAVSSSPVVFGSLAPAATTTTAFSYVFGTPPAPLNSAVAATSTKSVFSNLPAFSTAASTNLAFSAGSASAPPSSNIANPALFMFGAAKPAEAVAKSFGNITSSVPGVAAVMPAFGSNSDVSKLTPFGSTSVTTSPFGGNLPSSFNFGSSSNSKPLSAVGTGGSVGPFAFGSSTGFAAPATSSSTLSFGMPSAQSVPSFGSGATVFGSSTAGDVSGGKPSSSLMFGSSTGSFGTMPAVASAFGAQQPAVPAFGASFGSAQSVSAFAPNPQINASAFTFGATSSGAGMMSNPGKRSFATGDETAAKRGAFASSGSSSVGFGQQQQLQPQQQQAGFVFGQQAAAPQIPNAFNFSQTPNISFPSSAATGVQPAGGVFQFGAAQGQGQSQVAMPTSSTNGGGIAGRHIKKAVRRMR